MATFGKVCQNWIHLRHGTLTVMQLGIIVLGQLLKLCHAWYVFCAAHIITYRCTKFSQLDRWTPRTRCRRQQLLCVLHQRKNTINFVNILWLWLIKSEFNSLYSHDKTIHRQHQTVDTINDIRVRTGCRRSQPLETAHQSSDGGRRSYVICRKEEERIVTYNVTN